MKITKLLLTIGLIANGYSMDGNLNPKNNIDLFYNRSMELVNQFNAEQKQIFEVTNKFMQMFNIIEELYHNKKSTDEVERIYSNIKKENDVLIKADLISLSKYNIDRIKKLNEAKSKLLTSIIENTTKRLQKSINYLYTIQKDIATEIRNNPKLQKPMVLQRLQDFIPKTLEFIQNISKINAQHCNNK